MEGRIQSMDPGPWTTLLDLGHGPTLIFEDEFFTRGINEFQEPLMDETLSIYIINYIIVTGASMANEQVA